MIRRALGLIALTAIAACGGGKEPAKGADSLAVGMGGGDTALTPTPPAAGSPAAAPAAQPGPAAQPAQKPAPRPAAKPVAMSLDTGTVVASTANDSLHSRHNKVGDYFKVTVSQDVKDAKGRVAIPAGSVVTFKVAALAPIENKNDTEGKIRLEARDVTIDGTNYPLSAAARTVDVEHVFEGRGVTGGDVAKAGGAAAGGAVVGGVVGGKTGAIVGGVAGAAAGTAVAVQTADRDVVVRPGMAVKFRLTQPFSITR